VAVRRGIALVVVLQSGPLQVRLAAPWSARHSLVLPSVQPLARA